MCCGTKKASKRADGERAIATKAEKEWIAPQCLAARKARQDWQKTRAMRKKKMKRAEEARSGTGSRSSTVFLACSALHKNPW